MTIHHQKLILHCIVHIGSHPHPFALHIQLTLGPLGRYDIYYIHDICNSGWDICTAKRQTSKPSLCRAPLTIGRDCIRTEQEQCLLWCKLDTLPNHIMKLSHSQVCRYKILLFVNIWYVWSIRLFTNHRNTVRIFGTDTLRLWLSFLFIDWIWK